MNRRMALGVLTLALAIGACRVGDEGWDGGPTGPMPPSTSHLPTRTFGAQSASQLALGWDYSCALAGAVAFCWGANDSGQLGGGETPDRATPTAVQGLTQPVKLAAGTRQTCALESDGTVRCWGAKFGDSTGRPAPVPAFAGAVDVSVGYDFACAVSGGRVRCQGENFDGQLGGAGGAPPDSVPGIDRAKAVAAGYAHACALSDDGSITCWGLNNAR